MSIRDFCHAYVAMPRAARRWYAARELSGTVRRWHNRNIFYAQVRTYEAPQDRDELVIELHSGENERLSGHRSHLVINQRGWTPAQRQKMLLDIEALLTEADREAQAHVWAFFFTQQDQDDFSKFVVSDWRFVTFLVSVPF